MFGEGRQEHVPPLITCRRGFSRKERVAGSGRLPAILLEEFSDQPPPGRLVDLAEAGGKLGERPCSIGAHRHGHYRRRSDRLGRTEGVEESDPHHQQRPTPHHDLTMRADREAYLEQMRQTVAMTGSSASPTCSWPPSTSWSAPPPPARLQGRVIANAYGNGGRDA
ncbi:MAG: hypothetical protein ACRDZO_03905 [Egibacteraceae bacterium]